jgi:hypothetical protein
VAAVVLVIALATIALSQPVRNRLSSALSYAPIVTRAYAAPSSGLAPYTGIDVEGLRAVSRRMPAETTYYTYAPQLERTDPTLNAYVHSAALLFLLPARPVADLRQARWVVGYDSDIAPPGVSVSSPIEVGRHLRLWRVHGRSARPE